MEKFDGLLPSEQAAKRRHFDRETQIGSPAFVPMEDLGDAARLPKLGFGVTDDDPGQPLDPVLREASRRGPMDLLRAGRKYPVKE